MAQIDDLTVTCAMTMYENLNETNRKLRQMDYELGFHAGFAAGGREGLRQARRKMQVAMGLEPEGLYEPTIRECEVYDIRDKGIA